MKNQAYYDNLNLEQTECRVEQQFRDSIAFRIFALLACGACVGGIFYEAFFRGVGI